MEDGGRSFFGLEKTKLCRQLSFNQDGIKYSNIGRKLQPRLDSANKEEEGWQKIDPLKLVLGQVIGSGSDGVVHKGQYQGQTVAVKVLEKVRDLRLGSLDERLREEVSAWKNLDHPNITKMIGATKCMDGCKKECELSKSESSYCIVMEYVEGGNLMSYLLENQLEKRPPFKTIIRIALDIAKGLSYLHSKKIIHRDIKTENMLLGKKLEVKIADFGLAVFEPKDVLVRLRGSVGTPGYMAPESSYRCKSDVYSYGVCLWEIYCSQNSYQLHGEMKPPIPDKCPRSLRRLMERCMESDPKKRPEMKEVVLELQAIAAAESKGPGCFGFFN